MHIYFYTARLLVMIIVIVPYRATNQPERKQQLEKFLEIMPVLLPGAIIVVAEQNDAMQFNKGLLFNACVKELGVTRKDILCLHDVDLIPEGDIVQEYTRKLDANTTRHIGHAAVTSLDRYKGIKVGGRCFGGICLIRAIDFERVNGFPNDFWNWGGEDCVFGLRVSRIHNPVLIIERPSGTIHDLEKILSHKDKIAQLKATKGMGKGKQARINWYKNGSLFANGLAQAQYRLVKKTANADSLCFVFDFSQIPMPEALVHSTKSVLVPDICTVAFSGTTAENLRIPMA